MVNNAEEINSRMTASLMKNRKQLRDQLHEFISDLKPSRKREIKIPVEVYQ